MSKCFIIFGQINKKLLLPLFLIISQVLYILINELAFKEQKNSILELFMFSFGQISIRFIPYIIKISIENSNEKFRSTRKRKILHYFILCLLFYANIGLGSTADYLEADKFIYIQTNLFPNDDFLLMIYVESILLIFISICLLKYKYFKHHIISLVIFVFFGTVCFVFHISLGNNKIISIKISLFKIIVIIICRLLRTAVEATYFCYQKYMMEKLYYPYWNIAFVPGIILLFFSFVGIIFGFIFKDLEYFSVISYFTEDNNVDKKVLKLIVALIFHIIISPLTILIIFYFSPNFILIVYQFTSIAKYIISYSKNGQYRLILISIPCYIIQILSLLIYLEVLEFNFCGLNKNTKRNIDLRAQKDLLDEGRDSTIGINLVDIGNDYGVDISDKNENDNISEEVLNK